AAYLGFQIGDRIVQVNGVTVYEQPDFLRVLQEALEMNRYRGQPMLFEILRGGGSPHGDGFGFPQPPRHQQQEHQQQQQQQQQHQQHYQQREPPMQPVLQQTSKPEDWSPSTPAHYQLVDPQRVHQQQQQQQQQMMASSSAQHQLPFGLPPTPPQSCPQMNSAGVQPQIPAGHPPQMVSYSPSQHQEPAGLAMAAPKTNLQLVDLTGSWCYGKGEEVKNYVYHIHRAGSQLFFEQRLPEGGTVSGLLVPDGGPFLKAELIDAQGQVFGEMRLSYEKDEQVIVSALKQLGQPGWGEEIIARRVPAEQQQMPAAFAQAVTHPSMAGTGELPGFYATSQQVYSAMNHP
ncbi:unnamed protein product, partial [Polarella glacialis]